MESGYMDGSMMAPRGVKYSDVMPMAMAAKATVRKFRPQTARRYLIDGDRLCVDFCLLLRRHTIVWLGNQFLKSVP